MTDSSRRPLIVANWKMNYTHLEAIQVVQKLSYQLDAKDYEENDVVVCPPFTALRSVQTTLESDNIPIRLGAQNVHWDESGAFTGEVSAAMLAKLNVKYVIIGHSERRELLNETDEMVNKKCLTVLKAEMSPIICVGETLQERESGETQEKVERQLRAAFAKVSGPNFEKTVIAYEPIWAIGTGQNATAEDANATIGFIRKIANDLGPAGSTRILYGGSVKPGNIGEFMAMPEIDGALVGGASLDPDDFARIVRYSR